MPGRDFVRRVALLLALLCFAAPYGCGSSEARDRSVMPFPDGMRVLVSSDDGWIITGAVGQERDRTLEQLTEHLRTAKGWSVGPADGDGRVVAKLSGRTARLGPLSSDDFENYPTMSEDNQVRALIDGVQLVVTS